MEDSLSPEVKKEIAKPQKEKLPLPKREELPSHLVEIADRIGDISGTWNPVEIYTPTPESIEEGKKNVFNAYASGGKFNPRFIYSYAEQLDLTESKKRLRVLLGKIRQFKPTDDLERFARISLYFKINDDLATCQLVEGLKEGNEEKTAEALKQKYPGTDEVLLGHAREIYTSLTSINEKTNNENQLLNADEQRFLTELKVGAEGIKEAFEWALQQYGILKENGDDGFRVEVSSKATSIDVRDKSVNGPTVFIPSSRNIASDELLELMTHEIEGHARQSINGARLFLIGGGKLKIDNEMLYEGLGIRYEDRFRKRFFGEESGEPLPFFTFATKAAEEGKSFFQIFSEQVNMRLHVALKISPGDSLPNKAEVDVEIVNEAMDDAWRSTYRVMRGHLDTSNPESFAMAKDLAYLRGWLLDKELVDENAGYLNEAAVIHFKALKLLTEFDLSEEKLPIPFKDITIKYWEEILKPQMTGEKAKRK